MTLPINPASRKGWRLAAAAGLLAACASTPTPPPMPTAGTPAPPTSAVTAPAPTATIAAAAPTERPATIAYFALPEGRLEAAVRQAAQDFGWAYERAPQVNAEALERLAGSGARVVVLEGVLGQEAFQIAPAYPQTHFILVYPAAGGEAAEFPANLLLLGGPGSRLDQAGFLAGMAAGFATETDRVAAVADATTVSGRNYRHGFQNGVRYACPKCRIDLVDWPDAGGQVAILFAAGTDVFFHAAGDADAAAALAGRGAQVITAAPPTEGGLFLTSVYVDAAPALRAALDAAQAGQALSGAQPFSLAGGAIVLAPYQDPDGRLSPLDRQDIAVAQKRLAERTLETGVDPATGAER